MKSQFQTDVLYPSRMSAEEKKSLTETLYAVHRQIFEGVSQAEFQKYVIEPDSKLTRIRLYRDAEGQVAGYLSFQVFETGKRRRDPLVMRTEVGFLPQYRRYNITLPTLIRDAVKFQLGQLGRKAYFLATPVHPTPYRLGLMQLPEVWPHPEKEMPGEICETFSFLKERLKIQPAGTGSEFTCQVGWKVKEPQILRDRIASRQDPIIQYYLQHNPDYHLGYGMLMLVPLTFKTYFMGFGGLISKQMQRSFQWKDITIRIPMPRIRIART